MKKFIKIAILIVVIILAFIIFYPFIRVDRVITCEFNVPCPQYQNVSLFTIVMHKIFPNDYHFDYQSMIVS